MSETSERIGAIAVEAVHEYHDRPARDRLDPDVGHVRAAGMSSIRLLAGTGLKRVRLRLFGSIKGDGEGPAACHGCVITSVEVGVSGTARR